MENNNLDGLTVDPRGGELATNHGAVGHLFPYNEANNYSFAQFQSGINSNNFTICLINDGGLWRYRTYFVFRYLMTPEIYVSTGLQNQFGLNTPGIEAGANEFGFDPNWQ